MLNLERLEDRCVPAASIALADGVLEIVGTDLGNVQDSVRITASADFSQITVSLKTLDAFGNPFVDAVAPVTVLAADVDEIVVNAGDADQTRCVNNLPAQFLGSVPPLGFIRTTYFGTDNSDYYSGNGNLTFFGEGSMDFIFTAGGGPAIVFGGAGDDSIRTSNGNDFIDGGDGNDRIRSGAGDDTIFGGAGDDYIDSGVGTVFNQTMPNDTVHGGTGFDTLENPKKWWSKSPPEKLVTGIELFL